MTEQLSGKPWYRRVVLWAGAGVLLTTTALLMVVFPSGAASTEPALAPLQLVTSAPGERRITAAEVRRQTGGPVVEYWVGAVPTSWNVVPNGKDPILGNTFQASRTTMQGTIYRRFTPNWESQMKPGSYGLVGPLIRAEVGDTILIHFKNFDPAATHSMHFHGVEYEFPSDGAFIPGVSGPGADVKPGQTFTYRLKAGSDATGVWPYHDHSPSMDDSIRGGLYGAMSIRPRGERLPDKEFVVFFESHRDFNTIDGLAFITNTPIFRAKVGDTVQWDVLALGSLHHTFHVHGHRWATSDGTRDVQTVGPAESFRVRWKEDRAGTWLYHCHVEDHMMNGMIGLYVVSER